MTTENNPDPLYFTLVPGEPLHRGDQIWWNGKWQEILAGWETGATVTKGMHYRRKVENSDPPTLLQKTYHPKTAAAVFDVMLDELEESPVVHAGVCDAIEGDLIAAHREALTLATSIWRKEFQKFAPNWGPCDSAAGIISQIDNMYAGIRHQRDEARANNQQAICVYCGTTSERTPEAMLAHVSSCEKHPMAKMIKILDEIDEQLYSGMLPMGYEPDRALTIKTINELSMERQRQVDAYKEELKGFADHVGAPTAREAFDVLLRTKLQDEEKIEEMFHIIKETGQKLRDLQGQYNELIMAVICKFSGETRHQTALRYIQEAEKGDGASQQEATQA